MLTLLPHLLYAQQTVLLEAPLVLQAPGHEGVLPAWYDGKGFWVEPEMLMERLGYEIFLSDSTQLIARDRNLAVTFDYAAEQITVNTEVRWAGGFAMSGDSDQMLITMEALQSAFGADMEWDEAGLTLRLSSAARLFDPAQFGPRRHLSVESGEEVLFGRERTLLGGLHIGYQIDHRWGNQEARTLSWSLRTAASAFGGTLRWKYSRSSSIVTYRYTMRRTWLTQLETGVTQSRGTPTLRFSNRPLVPRRVHRERILEGITIPHAIVRGKVGGFATEQVQADRDGRYAVRVPVFYGSTYSEIEVEPLGGDPEMVMDYHNLTPPELLRSGTIEYDVLLGRSGRGEFAWGLAPRLTLHAMGTLDPRRGRFGAAALPLPTLTLDADYEFVEQAARGYLRWWRPWGGLHTRYHYRRLPAPSQDLTTAASVSAGELSLHGDLSHRTSDGADAATTLGTTLGWQFLQMLDLQAGGSWGLQAEEFALRATLRGNLPFARPRIRVHAGVQMRDHTDARMQGGLHVYGKAWYTSVQLEQDPERGELGITATVQLNTDWAWISARTQKRGARLTHAQQMRGTILFGRDIRFSASHRETTQAVFRFFLDANLNRELDDHELLSLHPRVTIHGRTVNHHASGEITVQGLDPHQTYPVHIDRQSIPDPFLVPVTGYDFSFVATPGRTRYMDIALQVLPVVTGRLTGGSGAYAALGIVLYDRGKVKQLEVYSDGGFITQLPAGEYPITVINRLTEEVILQDVLTIDAGTATAIIQLPTPAR